jgi:tetratricopeptide (TPR) repeat protein
MPDGATGTTFFARLLSETGVSDSRFARQVNERSRRHRRSELGLARTTIGHWRRGMRPRDPMVAELAAAELSAVVGYPVTPADLGWRGETHFGDDDLGLAVGDHPTDTLRTLVGLSGRDMRRRDLMLDGTAFVATAFADPVLRALTGVIDPVDEPAAGLGFTPAPTGSMIRDMTDTFRRLDARYGSGEIRSQVIGFLHDRTRAALGGGGSGTDLFSALSELTQFCGWLAQDSERQSLAQRYYVQALALAEHADDVMLSGRVLAAMSDQAARLGHLRQSLSLARAALDRAERQSSPSVRAMLHDKAAWAHARLGDHPGVTRQLAAMDRAIGRAATDDGPPWAAHYNEADVAECHGHCLLLLGRPREAKTWLLQARQTQSNDRTRTRSYAEADLALAYLRQPRSDVEAALEAGHRSLSLAQHLESGRITAKLGELNTQLAEHRRIVAVREWRIQAATLLRGPSAVPA